jgi:ribosomal protein S18 acetylase RimI-like enzyme
MEVTFRKYTDADKQQLIELEKRFGLFIKPLDPLHRVQQLPGFHERLVEDTLKDLHKYQGDTWFALDRVTVVGCIVGIIWEQSELNRLEIGEHVLGEGKFLYLDKKYRGYGIGTKLLMMMETYFKEQACDSMWVSVFELNENAHNVYKKFGFVDREIGMLKTI